MTPLPRWRLVAGCVVLAALVFFAILFAPVYIRNLKLQSYVDGLTHGVGTGQQPDDALRGRVLNKAHELNLPVKADNVRIYRQDGGLRIEVQYSVTVTAPLYRVDLHFYPGAGSR